MSFEVVLIKLVIYSLTDLSFFYLFSCIFYKLFYIPNNFDLIGVISNQHRIVDRYNRKSFLEFMLVWLVLGVIDEYFVDVVEALIHLVKLYL